MATKKKVQKSEAKVDLGECGACHQPLAIMPVNSRLKKVACKNRRCNLYGTKLRYV